MVMTVAKCVSLFSQLLGQFFEVAPGGGGVRLRIPHYIDESGCALTLVQVTGPPFHTKTPLPRAVCQDGGGVV